MNKVSNLMRKTLIALFTVFLSLSVFFGIGLLSVNNAHADGGFSVTLRGAKDLLPKGIVGQEYDISSVVNIQGDASDYTVSCKVNFDDDSVFEITNGVFTPTEYGVYTIIIDPTDSALDNVEFNIYVESADGAKTFDHHGLFDVGDGSYSAVETLIFNGKPRPQTKEGQMPFAGLRVDLEDKGTFTFNKPVNLATSGGSMICVSPVDDNAATTGALANRSFKIKVTDANNPGNFIVIRPAYNDGDGCRPIYVEHSGKASVAGNTVRGWGGLLWDWRISDAGQLYVARHFIDNDTGLYRTRNDPDLKDDRAYELTKNGWAGFSGDEVYVSIIAENISSFLIRSIGEYDFTDFSDDNPAYATTVVDQEPVLEAKGSSKFFSVGEEIDLVANLTSKGVYGPFVYSPLANVSLVRVEGASQTPVAITDGKFVPTQSGIYIATYTAQDFDGDDTNTVRAAWIVKEQEKTATLKNVSYDDCEKGDVVEVQDGVLEVGGTDYPATAIVYYPDGSAHDVSSFTVTGGLYRVEYKATVEGVVYTKDACFYAKVPTIASGETNVVPEYGYGYYPDFVEEPGLKVELLDGETFTYDKIINIKDFKKTDALIKFYAMPHFLDTESDSDQDRANAVTDATKMYIRLTDVHDAENYITLVLDFIPDSTYHRASIGMGVSAGWNAGNPTFDKYGACTSSMSLSGWGGFGKYYDDGNGLWVHVDKQFEYNLDYKGKELFIKQNTSICTLDHPDLFSTPWQGFTTGECRLSIFFSDYRDSSVSARVLVTDIGNEKVTDDDFHVDNSKPVINVDFQGYEESNLPTGVVGVDYPVYEAIALDGYAEFMTVTAQVFSEYRGARYSVPVVNGKFRPTKPGTHSIVYSVVDYFGNTQERTVEIDVRSSNVSAEIVLVDSQKVTSAFVGQTVIVPKFRVASANGRTVDSVYVKFNNQVIATNVECFVPTSVGTYTIVYEATDFLGLPSNLSYDITVTESADAVIRENPILPKYFIDGYDYLLDDLYGYAYSNGAEKAIKAKISVVDKDGKRVITNNVIRPSVLNSGDNVTVIYEFVNGSKTTEISYVIPTYDVYTYDEEEGMDIIHMEDFFVGDITAREATEDDGIFLTIAEDGAKINFINDLLLIDGNIKFALVADYANFSSFDLLFTDSKDGIEQVKVTINVVKGMLNSATYNGTTYNLVTVSTAGEIAFSTDMKSVTINGTTIVLDKDVHGMTFNGFKQGRAYMELTFNDVTAESKIVFTEFNNQLLGDEDLDMVRPVVKMNYEYGGTYLQGDDYVVKLPTFGDVLDSSIRMKLSVSGPNGAFLTAKDGTVLNGILCNQEYTITLKDIGNYVVSFKIESLSQKGGVYFWGEKFQYIVSVKDTEAPTIKVNVKDRTSVKVGNTVKIPKATVTDNFSENLTVYIYVQTPEGKYITAKGNQFKAEQKGEYVVTFMAMDDYGNMTLKTYTVVSK